MHTTRTLLATTLAVLVVLVAGCGGSPSQDEDPSAGESPGATGTAAPSPTSSAGPNATDSGTTGEPDRKDRRPHPLDELCEAIDPVDVARALGSGALERIEQRVPGDAYEALPGAEPQLSAKWSCTFAAGSDATESVTYSVQEKAKPKVVDDALVAQRGALGGKRNCGPSKDRALGARTRGIDCELTTDTGVEGLQRGFTAVSRVRLDGDVMLECFIAAAEGGRLAGYAEVVADVCGLLPDALAG